MRNYEYLKSLTIDEVVEFLYKYGQIDEVPWTDWFNETYCNNCESIEVIVPELNNRKTKCRYCELEEKCKHFVDHTEAPSMKEIIKLWLLKEKE